MWARKEQDEARSPLIARVPEGPGEIQGFWFGRPAPANVFETKYLGAITLGE
jgi:hypothetical protein